MEPGTTPGITGGQTPAPSSGTNAPAPSSSQPSGQPTGQPEGGDPFDFGGGAPVGKPGQGTTTPAATPKGEKTDAPPPSPIAGQPEPGVKNYLSEEFGGDPVKLNQAYASLVPKFTQASQNYSTTLQILQRIDQVAGKELRQILIQKGLVEPTDEERAGMSQPPAGATPDQPQPGVKPQPEQKPLTQDDVLRIIQERDASQESFQTMIQDFKTQNPDWEQFKPELESIKETNPGLFQQAAEGKVPLAFLLNAAKGMASPRIMKQVKDGALDAGLRGHDARKNAHMETPSQGAPGGAEFDPWSFPGQ